MLSSIQAIKLVLKLIIKVVAARERCVRSNDMVACERVCESLRVLSHHKKRSWEAFLQRMHLHFTDRLYHSPRWWHCSPQFDHRLDKSTTRLSPLKLTPRSTQSYMSSDIQEQVTTFSSHQEYFRQHIHRNLSSRYAASTILPTRLSPLPLDKQ